MGYIEGKNIIFPFGKLTPERRPYLATELINLKSGHHCSANDSRSTGGHESYKGNPIVMPTSIDPIGAGLVASLAHPSGNATGLTSIAPDLSGKRLELIKEIVTGVSQIPVLSNPTSPTVASR